MKRQNNSLYEIVRMYDEKVMHTASTLEKIEHIFKTMQYDNSAYCIFTPLKVEK